MAHKKNFVSPSDSDYVLGLKNPALAAFLSWLIPGAGQMYQGRTFKGVLFCICILGMFFCGVQMGEGRPVYCYYEMNADRMDNQNGSARRFRNYGYISQFLVGLPALPAIVQTKRFDSPNNTNELDGPVDVLFEGVLLGGEDGQIQKITGSLNLKQSAGVRGPEIEGRFLGTLQPSGEKVDLELRENNFNDDGSLGRKISADPKRYISLEVAKVVKGPESLGTVLQGTIPRPFRNWYQVPLQDPQLQDMNARLGKRWELAMVFTWIAGLLNILVIWDAYEGPAYDFHPQSIENENEHSPHSSQAETPNQETPNQETELKKKPPVSKVKL